MSVKADYIFNIIVLPVYGGRIYTAGKLNQILTNFYTYFIFSHYCIVIAEAHNT